MNIGDASKASKVSAKMIRYYERTGLIPPAERTHSGYRTYSQSDIHRLHFIRRARDLGFSVAEIKDLLNLWNDQSRRSADVKHLAEQHIAELERRMENMRQMAKTLKTLIKSCAGNHRPDCPILDELQQPDHGAIETGKRGGSMIRHTRAGKTAIAPAKRARSH